MEKSVERAAVVQVHLPLPRSAKRGLHLGDQFDVDQSPAHFTSLLLQSTSIWEYHNVVAIEVHGPGGRIVAFPCVS